MQSGSKNDRRPNTNDIDIVLTSIKEWIELMVSLKLIALFEILKMSDVIIYDLNNYLSDAGVTDDYLNDEELAADAAINDTFLRIVANSSPAMYDTIFRKLQVQEYASLICLSSQPITRSF